MTFRKFVPYVWWQGLLIALDEKCIIKKVLRNSKPDSVAQFAFWLTQALDKQVKEKPGYSLPNYATDIPKSFESAKLVDRWALLYKKIGKPFQTTVRFSEMEDEDKDELKLALVDKLLTTFEVLISNLGHGRQPELGSNSQVKHGHQSYAGKGSEVWTLFRQGNFSDDDLKNPEWQPESHHTKEHEELAMRLDDTKLRTHLVHTARLYSMDKESMLKAIVPLCQEVDIDLLQELFIKSVLAVPEGGKNQKRLLESYRHVMPTYLKDIRDKERFARFRARNERGLPGKKLAVVSQQADRQVKETTKASVKVVPPSPECPIASHNDAGGRALTTGGKTNSSQVHANVKYDMAKLSETAKIPTSDVSEGKPGEGKLSAEEKAYFKQYAGIRIERGVVCTKAQMIRALKKPPSETRKLKEWRVRALYDLWKDSLVREGIS
jgi:hypothetical protein